MTYYQYSVPGENGNPRDIIVSKKDIYDTYYPFWRERMIQKFGEKFFEENYTFMDCIEDFCIVNWAHEIKK